MMKKILFVTYDLGYAGTNSALSSIYNSLCDSFQIRVFSLIRTGIGEYSFRNSLLNGNYLTHLFYANYGDLSFKDKCASIVLKLFRRVSTIFRFDCEQIIIKSVVHKIDYQESFDLVVAFQEGRVTKFASHLKCPNKIAWVHCDYQRAYPDTKTDQRYYEKFKRIICVSEYTRKTFIQCFDTQADKIDTIYNLLDTERILQLSKSSIDDSRFSNEVFTIFSVGRLTGVKRFELIPAIAKQIHESGCDFHWYIIGDGELKESIENKIEEYNTSEYVTLLGRKANPYPYFKKAQLLVSTSYSEACPMIFNEAKILNLPIVTADFPTSSEFISNGVNGIISQIDDMSETISTIIKDFNLYNSIKKQCCIPESYNEAILCKLSGVFNN